MKNNNKIIYLMTYKKKNNIQGLSILKEVLMNRVSVCIKQFKYKTLNHQILTCRSSRKINVSEIELPLIK